MKIIDIFIAVFAGSSAVGGWTLWSYTLWNFPVGPVLFGVFVGVSILLCVAKPYLRYEDDLERLSMVKGTYDSISHILGNIIFRINSSKAVNSAHLEAFSVLRELRGQYANREDEAPDASLIDRFTTVVNDRYPLDDFWYPEEQEVYSAAPYNSLHDN